MIKFSYSKQQKSKLGKIINFSFTPIETCVKDCKYCYAKQAYTQYPVVKKAWDNNRNYLLKYNSFPDLPKSKNKLVRFLVSGDFEKPIILKAFIDLVKRYPDYKFFGFTKVWTKKEFIPLLKELNSFENVYLRLSIDNETGYKTPKGFKVGGVEQDQTRRKTQKRFFTCQHTVNKINCDVCGICYKTRKNVLFPLH